MSSKAMVPILLGVVACCCLSSVVAGGLWAGNVLCDTTDPGDQSVGMNCASVYESSGSPATGTPAAVGTPRQRLIATGQAIQVAELTITSSPKPVIAAASQPTGITATGSFTLSTDISMTALPGELVRVIGQGAHPGSPALWLFAAGAQGTTWFKFHVGEANEVLLSTTTTPPTYNTYYNITAVYDATTQKATLYHNGVLAGSSTIVPAKYVPPTPTAFGWNDQNVTAPTIKVKNTYWFNKALTAAEVSTLPGTSGTTSGYTPQPLSMGVSGYTKEGYMVPY